MVLPGKLFSRFARNERGNVAVMFAVSLIPMLGAAGLAMDQNSGSNARSTVQSELDAAALDVMKAAVSSPNGLELRDIPQPTPKPTTRASIGCLRTRVETCSMAWQPRFLEELQQTGLPVSCSAGTSLKRGA